MRAILVLAAFTIAGCGVGHLVRPDDHLALGTDTLFVLAVHSNEYATLTFCRDADYGSCLTTPQLRRDQPVQLYQVPAGRYCLLDILIEPYTGGSGSVHIQILPERSVCFVARTGVIAYPGDLELTSTPVDGAYWTVVPHWSSSDDIDQRVDAQYPVIRGAIIEVSRPVPYLAPAR